MYAHKDRFSIQRKKLYIERENTEKAHQNIKSGMIVTIFLTLLNFSMPLTTFKCNCFLSKLPLQNNLVKVPEKIKKYKLIMYKHEE